MSTFETDSRPALLIVDDDPEVARALTFMMDLRGFRVEHCGTAREAIALTEAMPGYACLVIDHGLPDHQGLELLAMLRHHGVTAPAVLITTAPSADLRRRARTADATIVEKPLLDDSLLTQIRRLIAAH